MDALSHLQSSLHDPRRPLTETQQRQVRQTIERSKTFVATVQLTVGPEDADIHLDGRRVDLDDLGEIRLDPGSHEIAVSAPGHGPAVRRVRAVSGQRMELEIRLRANDGREASVLDTTSAPQEPPQPNDSTGETARPSFRPWAYASASLAATAAVGSVAAFLVRRAAIDDFNDDDRCLVGGRTRQENCGDLLARGDTAEVTGISLAAGATAFAVTSLVLFLVGSRSPEVTTSCGPGPGVGLSCRHLF